MIVKKIKPINNATQAARDLLCINEQNEKDNNIICINLFLLSLKNKIA